MSIRLPNPAYLGDGIYVEQDGYRLWLGMQGDLHMLALEPQTLSNLIDYANRFADALEAASPAGDKP